MTTKATRHTKTPAQRAQEQVDILQRRLDRVRAAKDGLETQVRVLVTEERIVAKRLTYAEASPDLPQKLMPAPRAPHPISP